MNIEIYPLKKIVIDDAEICFGMKQFAVEMAIGKGQLIGSRYYYFNNELAVDYRNGEVEFIEFLGGIDGLLKPVIYGVSVFDTRADELVEILKKQNNDVICDTEKGYSYQFSDISIGVYREAVSEEITEMIKEAASYGNPMSDDEINYEMKRVDYWATIGIGVAGYYK